MVARERQAVSNSSVEEVTDNSVGGRGLEMETQAASPSTRSSTVGD